MTTKTIRGVIVTPRAKISPKAPVTVTTQSGRSAVVSAARQVISDHRSAIVALADR